MLNRRIRPVVIAFAEFEDDEMAHAFGLLGWTVLVNDEPNPFPGLSTLVELSTDGRELWVVATRGSSERLMVSHLATAREAQRALAAAVVRVIFAMEE